MTYHDTAHILFQEISRLDSFGIAAKFFEQKQAAAVDVPEYKYHGAVDWRDRADAANARALLTSRQKNRPATWQNAGSLAASATGKIMLTWLNRILLIPLQKCMRWRSAA